MINVAPAAVRENVTLVAPPVSEMTPLSAKVPAAWLKIFVPPPERIRSALMVFVPLVFAAFTTTVLTPVSVSDWPAEAERV